MDVKAWKDSVVSLLRETIFSVRQLAPDSIYGYLCASAVLPVVTAVGQGDYGAVLALGTVAGSVGANLIANQIQSWRDDCGAAISPELAKDLSERAASDLEWRRTLDELVRKLDVPVTVRSILDDADPAEREWFTEALRSELARSRGPAEADRTVALLTGSGAMVSGSNNIGAGECGIAAGSVADSILSTGHGSRVVRTGTYIERQQIHEEHTHSPYVPPDPHEAALRKARLHYLKRLRQRCHVLPLAAMGGQEGACQEVTLDKVYVQLDTRTPVPLSEAEKAERERKPAPGMHPDGGESRPLSAMEAAGSNQRLVLLGDPGSGKSTFVSQLAALLAEAGSSGKDAIPGWGRDLVPVFTVLRDLASDLAGLSLDNISEDERKNRLVEAVWKQWRSDLANLKATDFADGLEEALCDGKVLLVFDGMDEIPEAMRLRARESLLALLRAYPAIRRVIVTCRIRSYIGSAVLHGFQSHTLAPFDEEKIQQFVRAWYQAQADLQRISESTARTKADELQRAAIEDHGELASNPMLLTTMALIHQREVGLPKQRVRLYALAVQVLLGRWQERKGIIVSERLKTVLADDLKLRNIMERVAYGAHGLKRDGEADLARKDLLALLEEPAYLGDAGLAVEFLDYVDMRAGILVGRGGQEHGQHPQSYSFPHRTFQEYLAGCWLLRDRSIARTYWTFLSEGDYWYLAGQLGAEELLFNRKSPMQLLDLMYGLCPSSPPKRDTEWRAVVWSGQMATIMEKIEIESDTDKPDGGPAYLTRLLPRLVGVLRQSPLNALERAEAGRILARLGDPRVDVMTVEGMEFRCIPAGPFIMGGRDDSDASVDAQYQRTLTIPYDFLISRYPVTNAQFREFIEAGGYKNPKYWREAIDAFVWKDGKLESVFGGSPRESPYEISEPFNLPNHPAVCVTWYEAVAYTRWLTERLRTCRSIPGKWEIRLPSEAEWEKTARGGIQISDGSMDAPNTPRLRENPKPARFYPWGDSHDSDRANSSETGIATTSAVGCFPRGASPYGVEELAGNVWEWTGDLWSRSDREGRASESGEDLGAPLQHHRVLRGGAFYGNKYALGCAFLDGNHPDYWYRLVGFRVVASPSTSDLR